MNGPKPLYLTARDKMLLVLCLEVVKANLDGLELESIIECDGVERPATPEDKPTVAELDKLIKEIHEAGTWKKIPVEVEPAPFPPLDTLVEQVNDHTIREVGPLIHCRCVGCGELFSALEGEENLTLCPTCEHQVQQSSDL